MSAPPRQRPIRPFSVGAIVGVCLCLVNPFATGSEIDFYRDVYPVLKSNCIACHNKTITKAALNMETPETMRKGGDSGEGVIPGNGAESLIFQAAAHTGDVEMPPKGNKSGASKLTPKELELLKAWIDQGAKSSLNQARQVVWQPLPPGVNPIYSVAMSRDGRLAACGRANQVFIYDLATRQLVTRLADDSLSKPGSPQITGVAHRAIVQSLALSPDGLRLASGSFREVKIWRRENSIVTTRKGDPALGAVLSVLSANGTQVVSADMQGILHVLDAANGMSLKTIPTGSQGRITLLRLSPDASMAAVYRTDGSLSLWDLVAGDRIASKEGLAGVRSLAWTRDGKAIATGGQDKIARIWSWPAGEKSGLVVSKELEGATGVITAIETGSALLLAASTDGKVHLWNTSEVKPARRELAIDGVVTLGLSGDDKRFAAGRADGTLQVWELSAGKPIIELSGDVDTNAQMAALDRVVAAEGLEMAFQKQEVARIETQNKALEELLKKANETIATVRKDLVEKQNELKQTSEAREAAQNLVATVTDQIAKSPGGKPDAALEKSLTDSRMKLMAATLAESTSLASFKSRKIHLKDAEIEAQNYSAAQARNKSAVDAVNAALTKANASKDKASADSALTRKAALSRKVQPLAVRFSSDTETVAAAYSDGSLRIWAVASGLPIQHLASSGMTAAVSLESCANGAITTSTADGLTSRVSTPSRWILERTIGGETAASPFVDRVNALRFSPDGKTLAAGGGEPTRSGDISLWDLENGTLINEWKERHSDAVLSLDFSPDGKLLASGAADKIARVTDIASGKLMNTLEGHTHHVLGVSFRADGRVLATSGADTVVVMWDMISGERKRKVEGWSKEVTSVQFIGATNQILTSSGDNLVRIVDEGGAQIRAMPNLPDFMQSAASSATANIIIGGGEDSLLRVWNGTTGQELAVFGAESPPKSP
ncbi:c-type cytochrome domain-containing protein [Isosphaeraceae bacterium EP7]